jgi:MoaA/NifB/PqqE/SkfB family radical SAM enzyme
MIDTLHIELTTFCNAACPSCTRTNLPLNKFKLVKYPLIHLNYNDFQQKIDKSILDNLKKIQLCGTYGDPILHPQFFQFIDWFLEKTNAHIEISTNGNPHKKIWWEKLAQKLKCRGYVIFGLDGMENTHAIYRKNTDFNKIIDNATSFINSGGDAHWQFIPFKHNEKDIIYAKKLSQKLGFSKFFIKDERPSGIFEPWSKQRVSFDSDQTLETISERCLFFKKILYMQADGNFLPCCYMGNYSDSSWKHDKLSEKTVKIIEKDLQKSWQNIETTSESCQKWCINRKFNA